MVISSDIKPTNGVWTHFRTTDSRSCIYYKSNKGNVDLTFNGQADNIEKIKELVIKSIGDYHSKGISIIKTGKSCAIRKLVPIVDFSRLFDEQELFVKESFDAVHELAQLYNKLDLLGIYNALK